MPKESRAERAGVPKTFRFGDKPYRIGSASAAQHFELEELVKKLIPDPLKEAARDLGEIGEFLTADERKALLLDAQERRKKVYVSKVRILWDDECDDPIASILSGDDAGFTKADAESLGIGEDTTVGQAARIAWKQGVRPDHETPASSPKTRLRDALNERFNDQADEVTEQVAGWPPPLDSSEAYMVLYVGPGLPETLAILLPPHNEGMTRDDARSLGRALLEDTTGEGLKSLGKALAGDLGDDDEADKSNRPQGQ